MKMHEKQLAETLWNRLLEQVEQKSGPTLRRREKISNLMICSDVFWTMEPALVKAIKPSDRFEMNTAHFVRGPRRHIFSIFQIFSQLFAPQKSES